MLNYINDFKWEKEMDKKLIKDAFLKVKKEKEEGIAGYFNLGEESLKLIETLKEDFKDSEVLKNANTIVVMGIGGSSLGTKALYSMFKHKHKHTKRVIFLENPDEINLSEQLAKIEKNKSIFIVVSKSGSTIETISIFKEIISRFSIDYKNRDKNRVIAVTDYDSVLYKFANYYSLKVYNIPKNVGGRFSVLSAVGVVPLTLAGFDMRDILKGATEFKNSFFANSEQHLLEKAAFIVQHKENYPMNVLFAYAYCLEDFTKWYVQLWGESLGKIDKDGNNVGLTPIGHIGPVDQHSFLQLIMQGPRDKTVTFIKIKNFEKNIKIPDISLKFIEKTDYINGYTFNELVDGECEATKESIKQQGINVDEIVIDSINGKDVGRLILYYELLTSLCGAMLNINTYNQPGVELGKEILVKKFTKKLN